jgi:hypothetical protein
MLGRSYVLYGIGYGRTLVVGLGNDRETARCRDGSGHRSLGYRHHTVTLMETFVCCIEPRLRQFAQGGGTRISSLG